MEPKENPAGGVDREINNMVCQNCVNNNLQLGKAEKERFCSSCNLKDKLDVLYRKKFIDELRGKIEAKLHEYKGYGADVVEWADVEEILDDISGMEKGGL